MIEDVSERNEREICEFGRVLTEQERAHLAVQDEAAENTAARLRAQRDAENRERELHREQTGHYPTQLPCLKCQAEASRSRQAGEAMGADSPPTQLHGEAIECPQCKHVMLRSEVADYRAHGQECLAYEIRMRRNEATLSELSKRLVAAEQHSDRIENAIMASGQERLMYEIVELRTSLLALARHLLTPGECLVPDGPMYCGGSDLCPCRTESRTFHGTCGVNEELVKLLNDAIKNGPPPAPSTWEANAQLHLVELDKRLTETEKLARDAHAGAYPQGFGR